MRILNNMPFPIIAIGYGIFSDSEEIVIEPGTLGYVTLESNIRWDVICQEICDTTGYTVIPGETLCLKKGSATVHIRQYLKQTSLV